MDFSTIIFFVATIAALLASFAIEGGKITALVSLSPAIIVIGGTIGAVLVSYPLKDIKSIGKVFKVVLNPPKINLADRIIFFRDLSYKTRKNGLLTIESEVLANDDIDPFLKKGLQLVVDGVEPATIQSVLEMEVEMMSERHVKGSAMFESAGGYAPTMGIIGTVMSLVNVLGGLGGDSSDLGPKVATAFIATLYGISTANLFWLPIGNRLKVIHEEEYNEKSLLIEGIILIQTGTNPNTIVEKLKGFLNKKEIGQFESQNKGME